MIFKITSSKNEKFKFFKSLQTKKSRQEYGLFTVEGIKSVCDACYENAEIDAILVSESFFSQNSFEYYDKYDTYVISDIIFPSLSDTKTPQGILAVIKQKSSSLIPDTNKSYIYLDRLQDPGNLGTIIRTADASGFDAVLLSPDSVDLYSPKTVRSSMGSFFHIDKYTDIGLETLKEFKKCGFSIVCTVLSDNTVDYTIADYKKPVVIVVGNEANGISDEVLELSDINIKIPIDGKAESLNAGVAASIIMYEVRRQRINN